MEMDWRCAWKDKEEEEEEGEEGIRGFILWDL